MGRFEGVRGANFWLDDEPRQGPKGVPVAFVLYAQGERVLGWNETTGAPRGLYCGSFGYMTAAGGMDWNILIRSIELQQNGSLQYFGGGAIVIDSDCAAEYAESLSKVEMITETLAEFLPPSAACATVAR